MKRHPIQPVEPDGKGVLRFKPNAIVRRLLDEGPFDLNQIGLWDVSDDDRRQLIQLIGCSLSGFSELHYVDDETYGAASLMALTGASEEEARLADLRNTLASVKEKIRDGVAELFGMHPDDLGEK